MLFHFSNAEIDINIWTLLISDYILISDTTDPLLNMTKGAAVLRARNNKFEESGGKRRPAAEAKKNTYGPWIIGLIIFLVFGSALLQIWRAATSSSGRGQAAEE